MGVVFQESALSGDIFAAFDTMREVHRSQLQLGEMAIDEIWINPKSRDDIPAVLKGLQHIWCDEALREQLYALLDEHILPEADRTVGRREWTCGRSWCWES